MGFLLKIEGDLRKKLWDRILQKKSHNFFLRSPSIFKRNPIKKNRLQFYMEIPLLFSKNHKLETIFEKSHRNSVILKIVGATPQLVQNLTPIRKLFCTFLYQCCYYPRPPL